MLLNFFKIVKAPRQVVTEDRKIDVLFEPVRENLADPTSLYSLGRMAATAAIFEPFRNALNSDEMGNCLLK